MQTTHRMYSKLILDNLNAKTLQDIAVQYGVPKSGKKSDIVTRILEHQEKQQTKIAAHNAVLARGAITRDDGFERVIQVFQQWCDQNGFAPSKISDSGVSYVFVDINEIRAAFADYDPNTSSLREDRMVPIPETKLDVFLEMLFNERDDWHIFDTTTQEREFDCDSEFNDRWMVEGMTKLYDETPTRQWCASSYANRD